MVVFIENLKKVFINWRLTVIVIWLLIGVAIIPSPNPTVSLIGIIIFFPFLVFLMFLFLLSLISKKDIFEYPTWKIVLFLVISLPIMLLISIVLIVLFIASVISYFFFTSWFILYGCYLMGKRVDTHTFKTPKVRPLIRTIAFFGGFTLSILLLYLFIIGPTLIDLSGLTADPFEIPLYFNIVYVLVGAVLIGLAITCIVLMFKKIFNAWFGGFAILVSVYTLYLVIKIYLGLVDTNPEEFVSIGAYIVMIIPDLFIIFYTLSTLMGSQAEFLSKRLKRFGLDTIIIWLILSKVTYEFIHYFPYDIFTAINIPWLQWFSNIDNIIINNIKNIAVLIFFVALLVIIGIYEIRKYSLAQKELKAEVEVEVKKLLTPQLIIEEPKPIIEENETLEDISTKDYEKDTEYRNNNETE